MTDKPDPQPLAEREQTLLSLRGEIHTRPFTGARVTIDGSGRLNAWNAHGEQTIADWGPVAPDSDSAVLSPVERITDLDRAKELGLTADTRRLRREGQPDGKRP